MSPTHRRVQVTPQMAAKWLNENNPHNRNKKLSIIEGLVADIQAGRWDPDNGETIKFNTEGNLEDGQNRLQAIALADKTCEVLVVRGVRVGAHVTIDTGARRTLSDTLKLRGERYWSNVGTTLKKVWLWEHGAYAPGTRDLRPSHQQLLQMLDSDLGDSIRDAARVGSDMKNDLHCPPGPLSLAWWVCSRLEDAEDDAKVFFERLRTGQGVMKDGEPVTMLRRRLNDLAYHHARRARVSEYMYVALIFKAWNAYRDNRRVVILQWKPGGATPESFPIPH